MATQKQNLATRGESILLNVEKISQNVNQDDIKTLLSAVDKEVGNRKLEKEEIEQLQTFMNVDAVESAKWKSVADVLKYVSPLALAENNPEAVKKVIELVLNLVGFVHPVANIAHRWMAVVPDRLFPVLIKIGGLASPDYLLYRGASMMANKKADQAKMQAEYDASVDTSTTTLIIVCKNKVLGSEMSKLINLEDDIDEETVVGIKDGTVHPIIWNEAAWETFREKLTENDKVLVIGKVKNTMPLTLQQICFEQFGVKYGWYNNIARIEADPKALSKSKDYKEFLAAMESLQVSEKLKKNAKFKFDLLAAGKLAIFPPLLLGDLLREDTEVRKQQLLFGLYHFYMQGLDEFLNSKEGE